MVEFEFRIPEDARLRAHISQRSNLKLVKTVMDHFDERQREDFRNSSLEYLAEISDIQLSAQLIQQLAFRTIRTDKLYELWFSVQEHLTRFGLQEHALGAEYERVLQRRRLKERYFKSNNKISLAQLQSTMARSSTPRADRYKLGLVLILEGVFNAPDNNVGIHLPTLSIVDNLDIFFTYPWGRVGSRRLLHGFRGTWAKKIQKAKKRKEKEIIYMATTFPSSLWAYEALPEVGERFAERVGERLPRLLHWSARKQPQHRTYDAFFKNVKLHVYATLHPTDAEAQQPYFSLSCRTMIPPLREDSDEEASEGGSSEEQRSGGDEEKGASGSDPDDEDGEDTGEFEGDRSSADEDTHGGDRGTSSSPRLLQSPSPQRRSTTQARAVGTFSPGLSRWDVEELLLDQRILFEMRLRTVKLEIE
ncbi:Hypothetical predicted protein [Olea europaea subsp. europaea]|uniref:DUF1985 domain-containing protein n=1 Tax=Olea europaea subsp. europaea TaxID=158383 RepID=A0A8S0UGC2_OLEEU|nr:Hypothetical predicted protein [Olea europaea subsp. europaea]